MKISRQWIWFDSSDAVSIFGHKMWIIWSEEWPFWPFLSPLHTTPSVIIAIVIFVISFLIINDERLESTYGSIVPIHYVIPLFFYLSKALYLSVIKKDLGNICLTIVLLTKFFLKICVRKICFWKIHFKNTLLKYAFEKYAFGK